MKSSHLVYNVCEVCNNFVFQCFIMIILLCTTQLNYNSIEAYFGQVTNVNDVCSTFILKCPIRLVQVCYVMLI